MLPIRGELIEKKKAMKKKALQSIDSSGARKIFEMVNQNEPGTFKVKF